MNKEDLKYNEQSFIITLHGGSKVTTNSSFSLVLKLNAVMTSLHSLPPPASLDIQDRNAAEQWREWKERWNCYAVATELDKKSPEVQVSVLLTVIEPAAHKVFNTFQLTAEDKKNPMSVLDAFEKYCQPIKNTAFERYRFNLRGQRSGESFDQYVTAL